MKTASQVTASNRISDINDECRKLRERYEREPRHSTKHTRLATRLHNLHHEKEMLEIIVNS